MKNLVFKDRPVKKLMEKFVGPYIVEKVKAAGLYEDSSS